mgnify:CR=1 FL=1
MIMKEICATEAFPIHKFSDVKDAQFDKEALITPETLYTAVDVVEQIEKIGRDMSIIAKNPFSEKDTFRFIIDSDVEVEEGQTVKVNIKPHKYHVFDKVTEVRVK